MSKICSYPNCTNPVFSGSKCRWHYKPVAVKQMFKHVKHLTLSQSDKVPATAFKICPVSKSKGKKLREYEKVKAEYFKDHPVCEFEGCESTAITLHHVAGRCGSLLTDKQHFKSLCWPHHRFVEENPLEAFKMGLVKSRLEK